MMNFVMTLMIMGLCPPRPPRMTIWWQMLNDDDGDNCRWWKIMMKILMIIAMKIDKIHLATGLHPHANWSRLLSPCRSDLMSTFVNFWKPSHPQPLITPLSTNNRRRKIKDKSISWPLHSLSVKHTPSSNHIDPAIITFCCILDETKLICWPLHILSGRHIPSYWQSYWPCHHHILLHLWI